MLNLPAETEQLARLVAIKSGKTAEEVIRDAVEHSAEAIGLGRSSPGRRRRMTVDQMLAVGAEIAAMPLLDARSSEAIMDDLNSP